MRLRQQIGTAHGMAEREPRLRAEGREHAAFEGFEIALIGGEIVDMAFAAIFEKPVREAVAAPIHRYDVEVTLAQFADHFEIFFDEFAIAVQDHDCAARAERCRPSCRSQLD